MRHRSAAARTSRRFAAGLAGLALVGGLAACSSEPERNEEGEIEEEGDLSAFSIEEGDCLASLDDLSGQVAEVPVIPCDQEHEAEVFALFDLPDGDFPAASVDSDAEAGCVEAFPDYFGITIEESAMQITYLTPSAESWDQGDQEVVCIAVGDAGTTDTEAPAEGTDTSTAG